METMLAFLEKIGNYLMLVRLTDILDVAIIAFLVYKLLDLVKSTRAENILKGVVMFLLALWLAEDLPPQRHRLYSGQHGAGGHPGPHHPVPAGESVRFWRSWAARTSGC